MKVTCNDSYWEHMRSLMPKDGPCGLTYDDENHRTICPHEAFAPGPGFPFLDRETTDVEYSSTFAALRAGDVAIRPVLAAEQRCVTMHRMPTSGIPCGECVAAVLAEVDAYEKALSALGNPAPAAPGVGEAAS